MASTSSRQVVSLHSPRPSLNCVEEDRKVSLTGWIFTEGRGSLSLETYFCKGVLHVPELEEGVVHMYIAASHVSAVWWYIQSTVG